MTDGVLDTARAGRDRPEYAAAAAWAAEVHGTLRQSRRTAWLAAAAAGLTAALLGVAVLTVGPVREGAPYLVPVDRMAAQAQTVRGLAPGPLTRDSALTDAFLARYVVAREGFAAGRLAADYRSVAAWSSLGVRARYDAEITRANPASPLALYGPGTVVDAAVTSVSRLTPTQALVSFNTVRRDPGLPTGEQRGWRATLTFGFTGAAMRNADRYENPLGFQVTEYRRDGDGGSPVLVPVTP